MPNNFEFLELELKTGFLVLFGAAMLLFGTVGYFMAFMCALIFVHVIVSFNINDKKQNPRIQVMEVKQQKQEKTEREEDEEMDDLLLLNPTDED